MWRLGQPRGTGSGWRLLMPTDFYDLWSGFSLCCRIRLQCTPNGVALSFPSESQAFKYTMPVSLLL
jgi:hypothetical protein